MKWLTQLLFLNFSLVQFHSLTRTLQILQMHTLSLFKNMTQSSNYLLLSIVCCGLSACHKELNHQDDLEIFKPRSPQNNSNPLETSLPLACERLKLSPMSQDTSLTQTIKSKNLPKISHLTPLQDRGVFWWSIKKHQYRIPQVLASFHKQNQLIQHFKRQKVSRVYMFAQPLLRANKSHQLRQLRHWHRFLHNDQIQSYLLVGSPVWTCDPSELAELLRKQFLSFQKTSQYQENFDGVYLDIEPHALNLQDSRCLYHWDQLSAVERRSLLYRLLKVVIATRKTLDSISTLSPPNHQSSRIKLAIYLPSWLDHLHTSDRIWNSAQQRDQFYVCLKQFADEISVAAYCRPGTQRVTQSLIEEHRLLGDQLRVALNVYHLKGSSEACQTWQNIDEIWQVTDQIQHTIRPRLGVDLENLTRLLDQL